MRQEFRSDHAAESQVMPTRRTDAQRHATVTQRWRIAQRTALSIARGQKFITGLCHSLRALAEQKTRQHRRDQHGEDQRAQQREGHRPGHRLEQPPFHALQREDRQVGRDDDGDGVEDRPLHFVRGFADSFQHGARCFGSWRFRWRTMFSTITTAPSTTMPKSSAPSESRLAEMCRRSRQMEAKSSENGMVSATMSAPRTLPRKRKRMIDDQDDAFGQVVQHGVRGVVHQIAAIEKRNDLHARRQDVLVEPLDLGVNAVQRRRRIRALAQEHDAFDHIVVIDHHAVGAVDGLADLPQTNLRPLRHDRRCP